MTSTCHRFTPGIESSPSGEFDCNPYDVQIAFTAWLEDVSIFPLPECPGA